MLSSNRALSVYQRLCVADKGFLRFEPTHLAVECQEKKLSAFLYSCRKGGITETLQPIPRRPAKKQDGQRTLDTLGSLSQSILSVLQIGYGVPKAVLHYGNSATNNLENGLRLMRNASRAN